MIVRGVRVMCSTGCGREATNLYKFSGGGLYYCDAHRPVPKPAKAKP